MKDMKMKKPKMPKMGAEISRPGMAMPQFASRAMRPGGMAKGGKIHEDAAMDKKLIRKEIARAEKMEHKSEKKEMKKGGAVKKMAVGGMAPPAGRVQKMPAPAGGGVRTMPAPAGRGGVRTMPAPAGGSISRNLGPSSSGGSMSMGMPPRSGVQTMPALMKKGGSVGKMARGGGVERKGKTKGKYI